MKAPCIAVACLTCAACATAPSAGESTREVSVPVAVTCQPALKAKREPPDTDEALRSAPDLFTRVKLLVAGRLERISRERELEAALRGCTETQAPTP